MPAPALLFRGGFSQRGGAPGLNAGHGKRQLFDIPGHAKKHVTEGQGVDALQYHGEDEHYDWFDPGAVEEGAFEQGAGPPRGNHPVRYVFREAVRLRRLDQVLVPDQHAERTAEQFGPLVPSLPPIITSPLATQ